ncbi:MAG: hypothetical protein GXO77_08120 [Calditrichaeota bacterium]|nr:hypothetical protein [Calditrichota bacterium]
MQKWSAIILIAVFFSATLSLLVGGRFDDRVNRTFEFDNRAHKYKIERLAVVGDFSEWKEWYYLTDRDGDDIWQVRIPLKRGWHSYRFVINGRRWLRDPKAEAYGGAYSNSMIFVDTLKIPRLKGAIPKTGSWLYGKIDSLYFSFDTPLKKIRKSFEIGLSLDSVKSAFSVKDSTISAPFRFLGEGEHGWRLKLVKKNSDETALDRSGILITNLENKKPKANAGATQLVHKGDKVILNGGLSFDPDFEPVTQYRWRQSNGAQKVSLINSDTPFPYFIAQSPGNYRFRLTVKDSMGLKDSDVTEVVVLPYDRPETEFKVAFYGLNVPVKKVALVGEFNNWNSSARLMKFDSLSNEWKIKIPLKSGKWEYKYVINDSIWIPDPSNPNKIADGWNGFNSVRHVPQDTTFEGTFVESDFTTADRLVIEFKQSPGKRIKYRWYGDVQNPAAGVKAKKNLLYFDKNLPQGSYFYYLVLEKERSLSEPKILLINHYQTTEWMDFRQTPAWADTAIVYEVFLRRFTPQGNFKSLISKLPYLKELGVNTIWLLPVYEGPTEHGYAPVSLFDTEADYGTLSEYREFIEKAHRSGMRIIFDFVANHLSDQHRFVKAAYRNRNSPLRDWFYWKPDGTWGYHNDWDTLVNLNYGNPWVRHYILNSALFWLNLGVDGFRCDVAWAVPHDFWKDFRREIKKVNPECLLLNEVLPRQPQFHDYEFDMSYDTDFYGNVLDVLNGKKPISAIPFGLEKSRLNYPKFSQTLRYLENHDLPRFVSQFGEKYTRIMAAVLFTLPGTPMIYYGQEYGEREVRPKSPEFNKNSKWFDFYQKLIKFRKRHAALKNGSFENILIDDQNKLWRFRRRLNNQIIDVIINLSDSAKIVNNVKGFSIVNFKNSGFKRTGLQSIKIESKSFLIIQKDESK